MFKKNHNIYVILYQRLLVALKMVCLKYTVISVLLPGADPGFGIRGGVSRRGFWGPLKVPQRVQDRALVGVPWGRNPPPPKLWGFEELHTFNYGKPTTPFLSDQKNYF
jgi:hypothetical protein